jgi:hypothetical protein
MNSDTDYSDCLSYYNSLLSFTSENHCVLVLGLWRGWKNSASLNIEMASGVDIKSHKPYSCVCVCVCVCDICTLIIRCSRVQTPHFALMYGECGVVVLFGYEPASPETHNRMSP